MKFIQNMKIRHKLTAIIMITCVISLVLVGTMFVIWGYTSARKSMVQSLSTQAEMLADNCKASVTFGDPKDAGDILSSLRLEPSIVYACINTNDIKDFADYHRSDVDRNVHPLELSEDGYRFENDLLIVFKSIIVDGETIGSVYLNSDLQPLYTALTRNVVMVIVVIFCVSLIAYLLSAKLQGVISKPILSLTDIARSVTEKGDLTAKAVKTTDDEIGFLVDTFNNMLEKLKKHHDDLEEIVQERTRQLKEATDRSEDANVAKSQFLANMSHEIRTPMNAIIGFSDILSGEDMTDEHIRYVNLVRDSAHNLLDLINDILDFSKIEAKQLEIEIVECSLGRILGFIDSTMRQQAEKKSLDFEVVTCDGLPERICTDPARLRQCLINLTNNALKFTEKGHVYVNVSLEDRDGQTYIRFGIEDTGIGIPKDTQDKIFEAFTQADGSTSRKYGGTGLGLTVTKQLAGLLGGDLTLTSQAGKGSVFSLTIPANIDISNQPHLDINAFHTDSSQDQTEQPEFSCNVLVAEDCPTNMALVTLLLEKMGLQVTGVKDGNQALQKVLTQQFDLIFMDMMMPNMNGYEAATAIKNEGITTPIVALTANAMKGDDKKCLEAGCDDYLTKPIDRRELLKTIAKYLPSKKLASINLQ